MHFSSKACMPREFKSVYIPAVQNIQNEFHCRSTKTWPGHGKHIFEKTALISAKFAKSNYTLADLLTF